MADLTVTKPNTNSGASLVRAYMIRRAHRQHAARYVERLRRHGL